MVTSLNAHRRADRLMKAATPALVLSAVVLFSANVHAMTVPVEMPTSIISEDTTLSNGGYEAIKRHRKVISTGQETIAGAEKVIRDADREIKEQTVRKTVLLTTRGKVQSLIESFDEAIAKYDKRSGEADFIAFGKLTDEQFDAQPEFQSVLKQTLENKDLFVHLIKGETVQEIVGEIRALPDHFATLIAKSEKRIGKAGEISQEALSGIAKVNTDPVYRTALAENALHPRGFGAEMNASGGWTSGDFAKATGENSTALGVGAVAEGAHATAVGHEAKALQAGAIAIGNHAMAVEGATAIGTNARATAKGAVAIGEGVVNDEENTVQFAKDGETKRLKNVAAGTNDTDAANVAQLRESATSVTSTLRTEMGESHQRSVKESVAQSNSYTDQRVGEIRKDMATMDKTFRQGIASSAALMMAAPYAPGKIAATAGTALYRGTGAVAVGVSYWSKTGTWNINGGVSTAGGNSTIVRLGGAFVF